MSIGNWIAVAAVIATVLSSIGIAYAHRKQMRQIEAFRQDTSVGLIPPPHPSLSFLAKYRGSFANAALGMLFLMDEYLHRGQPITRYSIFNIAAGVGLLLLASSSVYMERFTPMFDRTLIIIEKLVDVTVHLGKAEKARADSKTLDVR